jgi:hypothetical protein
MIKKILLILCLTTVLHADATDIISAGICAGGAVTGFVVAARSTERTPKIYINVVAVVLSIKAVVLTIRAAR